LNLSIILSILEPQTLLFMVMGVLVGIAFGSIPGLSIAMALAIVLPLTYSMELVPAISTLLAVYCGGLSGGLISAILLKMPGTAAAITTTFDGYPMARKGQGMRAISLALVASLFGGLFSTVALSVLTPLLSKVALGFGPFEYFGAAIFSLSLISTLIKGDIVNGFIACGIGVLLSCVGASPIDGQVRFAFGQYQLTGGLQMIVIIIGMFAMSELFTSASSLNEKIPHNDIEFSYFKVFKNAFKEISHFKGTLVRSSIIGTILGILPGLGGNASSMLAYAQAKKLSKTPEEFGTGTPEGIIAPESANNAVSGGAMIPMLALGVPGNTPVAIIMSAFLLHGISIGPLLMETNPELIKTIFMAFLIANILMFIFEGALLKYFSKIIYVSKTILIPLIAVFCITGSYIANNSFLDIILVVIFAVFAYILEKNKFSVVPVVMGFVLGSLCEQYYRRTINYFGDFKSAYFNLSVGSVLVTLALIIPIAIVFSRLKMNKKVKTNN
jgi:putative tricarboxylic transport membrane protein